MLAELGLARLSKFAHALDLSKLRAGAISAPELRSLGLSTHEIDRLLAWARGQASDSPLFKLRYGQGSPHKQSVLAPVRESAPAATAPPPPAMAKAGGKMLLRHAKKKASPRPALGVAKENSSASAKPAAASASKAPGYFRSVPAGGVSPLPPTPPRAASYVERRRAREAGGRAEPTAVSSPPVLLSGTANAAASSALVALHELQIQRKPSAAARAAAAAVREAARRSRGGAAPGYFKEAPTPAARQPARVSASSLPSGGSTCPSTAAP